MTVTPTSLVYSNQIEADMGQYHKEHVKVFVKQDIDDSLPMDHSQHLQGTETLSLNNLTPTMPYVVDNEASSCTMFTTVDETSCSSAIDTMGRSVFQNVYTLTEEPELEAQETQYENTRKTT